MGTRKERILQKLNPNLLKMTPKLSGDAGSVIDLDSEDSLEDGAKKLMMRFFKNQDLCEKNKRNLAHDAEFTISAAKYNEKNEICEVISETLTLPAVRMDDEDVSERPGRRLQQLKMELQEKMSAKWFEEYNKRVSERKSLTETERKHKKKRSKKKKTAEKEDEESNDEEVDEGESGEDDEEDEDANNADIEDEEDEEDNKDKELDVLSIASDKVINENSREGREEGGQESGSDEYNVDEEGCSLVPAYQPGGGMLYGGSELTQEEEGLPQSLLSPSIRFSLSECKISQCLNDETPKKLDYPADDRNPAFTEKTKLFSQNLNDCFDLNEAFEFCSGKFPDENEVNEADDDDNEDDELKSLVEEESGEGCQSENVDSEKKTVRKNILTFEDSESEEEKDVNEELKSDEDEGSQLPHRRLLSDDEDEARDVKTELKKKTRKNLQFSDEEDATNEREEKESDTGESSGDEEEEEQDIGDDCEQRSIHYDSEENEIINPKEFFEKEAELSGSEWSGDEDERGLDKFEAEEGDADVLDEDQVRSQLGRIHVRRVLDDDAREVRLIQEILFEDGDLYLDGKVRERKFKWKNLGTFEDGNEGAPKEDAGNSSEEDGAEEEEMRKMRHEKELFLMEKMAKKNTEDLSSDEEIVENFHAIKVASVKTLVKQPGSNEKRTEGSSTIDYTEISRTTKLHSTRGSFLTRNEEFLSKLAKATSGITDNVLGAKNSKNFVFATKSPEKINPEKTTACKRQIEESCSRREKKLKLLPPEIDTGPSILDLLA